MAAQTWVVDSPDADGRTGFPLGIWDISQQTGALGEVKEVKVLGMMAIHRKNAVERIVIAIDMADANASRLKGIDDIEEYEPGLLRASIEWIRVYKIPDGDVDDPTTFSTELKSVTDANQVVCDSHTAWRTLVKTSTSNISK